MWKSITYKEWLKTRWFLIIYAILGVVIISFIFLRVKYDINFSSPNGYWYYTLFMNGQYFTLLKYIPAIGALVVALAQYFPETVSKRIKLTFHLPVNENKALIIMMLYGVLCLLLSYIFQFGLFTLLSFIYFPSDIFLPALSSVLPWFLCGLAIYNFTALIVLEPLWKYRVLYLLVLVLFIPVYLQNGVTGAYSKINFILTILTLATSFSLLYSGYRFRKGEM